MVVVFPSKAQCMCGDHYRLPLIQKERRLPHSLIAAACFCFHLDFTPMKEKSKQSKRRDDALSLLNVIIEGLTIAENLSSITPAKAVFSTVGVILKMIRVSSLLLCIRLLQADEMDPGFNDQ